MALTMQALWSFVHGGPVDMLLDWAFNTFWVADPMSWFTY
jgi:hypothetical protein